MPTSGARSRRMTSRKHNINACTVASLDTERAWAEADRFIKDMAAGRG